MEWAEYIVSILSGLAITIPLIIKLIEYVQKAVKEKNWNKLVNFVLQLMTQAEKNFDNGLDRKAWVISMIHKSGNIIDYPIDENELSELIDNLCEMSKHVNIER